MRYSMKSSFQILAKDPNTIMEKGIRAFVTERLLNSSFEKGTALNINDQTVEVRIDGDRIEIEKFRKELENALREKLQNPTIHFTELREEPPIDIPPIMRSSQALLVGQLEKGIDVQLKILDALKEMNHDLSNAIKGMGSDMKEMRQDFHGMRGDQKEMHHDLADRLGEIARK